MGYEYCPKQCWDSLKPRMSRPTLGYFLYRLVHWWLLAATGWLLSRDISFGEWMAFSLVSVLVGCLELPVSLIIRRVRKRTSFSVNELNYVVPVALTVVSSWMACTPRFDLDYRLVFLIVFLSHPANYLIRWALVRSDSALNEKSASERGQAMAEAAAGDSGGDADEDRLKAGRRIGTLERWVIGCSWRLKISEKCHRCLVVRMDKTKTGTLCPRPTDRRIDNMQNPIPT